MSSLIEIKPSRVPFFIVATIKIKGTDLRFDFNQTGEILRTIASTPFIRTNFKTKELKPKY